MTESSLRFADLELSRRLERAEALSNSRLLTRARLVPDCGATWVDVAGVRAMLDGPSLPMTQPIARLKPRATADSEVAPDLEVAHDAEVDAEVADDFSRATSDPEVAHDFSRTEPVVRLIERGKDELYARTSAAGWAKLGSAILSSRSVASAPSVCRRTRLRVALMAALPGSSSQRNAERSATPTVSASRTPGSRGNGL